MALHFRGWLGLPFGCRLGQSVLSGSFSEERTVKYQQCHGRNESLFNEVAKPRSASFSSRYEVTRNIHFLEELRVRDTNSRTVEQ